jgi:hypothetical protein
VANDRSNTFGRSMLAPAEVARCRAILRQTHIDWPALGYDDHTIDELVEFLLRIIQSMVIAPPELRTYLRGGSDRPSPNR